MLSKSLHCLHRFYCAVRDNGFSLVEVCLVLAIISVMVSIVAPSYRMVRRHYQREAEVSGLYQNLSLARSEAIQRHVYVAICLMDSENRCSSQNNSDKGYLVFEDPSHSRDFSPTSHLLKTIPLSSDLTLSWQGFPLNRFLGFSATGMTDTRNGTFLFCPYDRDAHGAKAIFISQSGRLRFSSDQNHDGVDEDAEGKPLNCG